LPEGTSDNITSLFPEDGEEMSGESVTKGKDEKCIQHLSRKILKKKTLGKPN
jgi:hypothetical protein